jgi:hypothetical protein
VPCIPLFSDPRQTQKYRSRPNPQPRRQQHFNFNTRIPYPQTQIWSQEQEVRYYPLSNLPGEHLFCTRGVLMPDASRLTSAFYSRYQPHPQQEAQEGGQGTRRGRARIQGETASRFVIPFPRCRNVQREIRKRRTRGKKAKAKRRSMEYITETNKSTYRQEGP